MTEFLRGIGRKVADGMFADGFNEAANLSTDVVSAHITALLDQVKSGRSLNEPEQYLLAKFTDLKSELETEFHAFWKPADD